ncbi:unnamed protein product [Prunus brigantina]
MTSSQLVLGFRGGDDEIKAKDDPQLGGFPISNFNNRFDVGESRLAKIKAKISVEDFEYLKGFANSNKRIDEDDPRLVKIRAKISEEDANYLKGLANKRFGVNNTDFAKMNGRTTNSVGPRFFDNNLAVETHEVLEDTSWRGNLPLRQSIEEWRELNYCLKIRSSKAKLLSGVETSMLDALSQMQNVMRENSINKDWISIEGLTDIIIRILGNLKTEMTRG